jgi:hypothetical protein
MDCITLSRQEVRRGKHWIPLLAKCPELQRSGHFSRAHTSALKIVLPASKATVPCARLHSSNADVRRLQCTRGTQCVQNGRRTIPALVFLDLRHDSRWPGRDQNRTSSVTSTGFQRHHHALPSGFSRQHVRTTHCFCLHLKVFPDSHGVLYEGHDN